MSYLILFLIKAVDSLITQCRSISTYYNKKILTTLLVFVGQLLYYTIVKRVLLNGGIIDIIVVSVSSALGTYLSFNLADKFKKDSKWEVVISSNNRDAIIALCKYLAENNIRYIVNNGYTLDFDPTLNVIAFSETKNQSKLIDAYLAVHRKEDFFKEIKK